MTRERREKLLRLYRESDAEPYELSVKLSQEIGRTNREGREFSSLIKRQLLGGDRCVSSSLRRRGAREMIVLF